MSTKLSDKEVANTRYEATMNTVALRCAYYRANPQRFCEDYLNIHLKLFQQVLIYMMMLSTNFMFLASRGQKAFLSGDRQVIKRAKTGNAKSLDMPIPC